MALAGVIKIPKHFAACQKEKEKKKKEKEKDNQYKLKNDELGNTCTLPNGVNHNNSNTLITKTKNS